MGCCSSKGQGDNLPEAKRVKGRKQTPFVKSKPRPEEKKAEEAETDGDKKDGPPSA